MKRLLSTSLILLLFVGCQDNKSGKLDTSNLKIIDTANNEHGEVAFAVYEAPSVRDSLKALPFKMTLPRKFPFEAEEFQTAKITDLKNDGETLVVAFRTSSKNKGELIVLNIKAYYPSTLTPEPENARYREVELKNGIVGRLYTSSIFFQVNEATISVSYLNTQISNEQSDKELIEIANQMY